MASLRFAGQEPPADSRKMILRHGLENCSLQMLGCRRPRSFLRELYKADADVIPDHERGILKVRMIGMADDAADALPAGMFEELNMSETIYPGTNLRMVFEVPAHRAKKRIKMASKKAGEFKEALKNSRDDGNLY